MKKYKFLIDFLTKHPLNEGRAHHGVMRFVKWHVSNLFSKKPQIVDWVDGTKIKVTKSEHSLTGNLYCGLMEYEDMGFLLHFLREEDVFVDVGANVGSFTILASGAVGSKSIAFEPVPSTFSRLEEQIAVNDIGDKVVAVNKAVGAEPGTIAFTSEKNCKNHVATPDDTDVIDVDVTSLDSALVDDVPYVIKIDVEGFEAEVVRGGEAVFARDNVRAVFMEMIGSGEKFGNDDETLHQRMLDRGFVAVSYDPKARSLSQIKGINGSLNIIYLRDIKAATVRCATAPAFTIHTAGGFKL